jgi:hypothetical protein
MPDKSITQVARFSHIEGSLVVDDRKDKSIDSWTREIRFQPDWRPLNRIIDPGKNVIM